MPAPSDSPPLDSWFPQLNYQPNYFQITFKLPSKLPFKLPLRSRSSTQKAPRDTLVYLRFCRFLRRFFIRYQKIILKKKSQLPLNSRSSTQKAPRDTLVYLRFGSFSRRFFFRYQRIILKSLDFSAQIDFFMNFCPRRATKLRSLLCIYIFNLQLHYNYIYSNNIFYNQFKHFYLNILFY